MRKVKEGIIDLEKCVVNNIAIQCDTEADEVALIKHLHSLGVTKSNGGLLYDVDSVLGEEKEYIVSYWSAYAEDGVYTIGKTRLNRYYLGYSSSHEGEILNVSHHMEEVPDEPKKKNTSKSKCFYKVMQHIFS